MSTKYDIKIKMLTIHNEELWEKVAIFAKNCSWQSTGNYLYSRMKNHEFLDWERVFVALHKESVVGFCALSKTSTVFDNIYSPYLSFLFVDEVYRGNKISQMMCSCVINYAKSIGFNKVFLYSDLVDFYEKLGFEKIDEKDAPWGIKQSIYMYAI